MNEFFDILNILVTTRRIRSDSGGSSGEDEGGGRLMKDIGWQEGVIQSVSNFMFQNRTQVNTCIYLYPLILEVPVASCLNALWIRGRTTLVFLFRA